MGMGMGMGVGWGEECGSGVVVVVVVWTRWVRAVWGVWGSMGQYGAVCDSGGSEDGWDGGLCLYLPEHLVSWFCCCAIMVWS